MVLDKRKRLSAIILAAGKGSRMLSDIPKVIHKIGGKYMLQYLIDVAIKVGVQSIYIVYGYKGKIVIHSMSEYEQKKVPIVWVLQKKLLGTGHAIQQVLPLLIENEDLLILYGDVPLVSYETLKKLSLAKLRCDISLLTAVVMNPKGYGRIIRNQQGNVIRVIEEDNICCADQKKIKEINAGIFIATSKYLKSRLNSLKMNPIKKEFYLTDLIKIACEYGDVIVTTPPVNLFEVVGINSKFDLVYLNRVYQRKKIQDLLSSGVMISDPDRFDLRGKIVCGKDVYIDINVIIIGHVVLGDRVEVGSGCILKDVIIENDVVIYPFSVIEGTTIKFASKIGPFARLRVGTFLQEKSCIGSFVEIKNTRIDKESNIRHLSYLGDSEIGSQVNVGAGTVICNYDGIKKNHTIIGNNVFIGANSQLVAPITISDNVTVGAGTTVTEDISKGDTVISRVRQFSILKSKKDVNE